MARFVMGLVLGLVLVPLGALLYLKAGHPPVAVADAPFPMERQIAQGALNARIDRDMPQKAPFEPSEAVFVNGAKIYREQCAFCHGLAGEKSAVGGHMFPDAPSLWQKHHNSAVVGVSDDPAGETYWKVANGIRLTGMPAYKEVLTEEEMWQVTLLLANADKPLPPAALTLLKEPQNFSGAVTSRPMPMAK